MACRSDSGRQQSCFEKNENINTPVFKFREPQVIIIQNPLIKFVGMTVSMGTGMNVTCYHGLLLVWCNKHVYFSCILKNAHLQTLRTTILQCSEQGTRLLGPYRHVHVHDCGAAVYSSLYSWAVVVCDWSSVYPVCSSWKDIRSALFFYWVVQYRMLLATSGYSEE